MGLDRSLDQEGIPDLEGPLPEKAKTGDPQEGASPPTDRPASFDWGVTPEEESELEPLDVRLARERPDFDDLHGVLADDDPVLVVEPQDEDVDGIDEEKDLVGREVDPDEDEGISAEEAAVHIEPEGW
jgi:hypothetical protein